MLILFSIYEKGLRNKDEVKGNHYNDPEYDYEYVDGYQDATEPASAGTRPQDSGRKSASNESS